MNALGSILKLCFCKRNHHNKGLRVMCWHGYTQPSLKTTGAEDDCSLG